MRSDFLQQVSGLQGIVGCQRRRSMGSLTDSTQATIPRVSLPARNQCKIEVEMSKQGNLREGNGFLRCKNDLEGGATKCDYN